jgi:hypothetical protein
LGSHAGSFPHVGSFTGSHADGGAHFGSCFGSHAGSGFGVVPHEGSGAHFGSVAGSHFAGALSALSELLSASRFDAVGETAPPQAIDVNPVTSRVNPRMNLRMQPPHGDGRCRHAVVVAGVSHLPPSLGNVERGRAIGRN